LSGLDFSWSLRDAESAQRDCRLVQRNISRNGTACDLLLTLLTADVRRLQELEGCSAENTLFLRVQGKRS